MKKMSVVLSNCEKSVLAQLSCFCFLCVALVGLFFHLAMPPKVQITACDVGQGDAVLIQYGQSFVLIDTGPNSDILRCLQRNIFFLDPTIDLVILTHPDKDHIGGWESVVERYRISELATNGQSANPDHSSVSQTAETGAFVWWPGVIGRVVWSADSFAALHTSGESQEETNAQSVGTYWWGESFGFLSLGDLECEQELAVAGSGLLNRVSLLKVSHHGSKSSSCLEFLQKIDTETAFISVGEKNSYNHPEENVIFSLEKAGAVVYRTDIQGEITYQSHISGGWLVEYENGKE